MTNLKFSKPIYKTNFLNYYINNNKKYKTIERFNFTCLVNQHKTSNLMKSISCHLNYSMPNKVKCV